MFNVLSRESKALGKGQTLQGRHGIVSADKRVVDVITLWATEKKAIVLPSVQHNALVPVPGMKQQ